MSKRMTPAQLLQAARAARLLRGGRTLEPDNEPQDAIENENDAQPQAIREMSDLIETTELLRNAVWARDREQGFETMASLLLQFMTAFGHDDDYVRNVLPSLGRLNELVLVGAFDDAEAHVLAWLAGLRQTSASLASALRQ